MRFAHTLCLDTLASESLLTGNLLPGLHLPVHSPGSRSRAAWTSDSSLDGLIPVAAGDNDSGKGQGRKVFPEHLLGTRPYTQCFLLLLSGSTEGLSPLW